VTQRPEVIVSRDIVLRQFASLAAPVFDHTGAIKAVLTAIGRNGVFDIAVNGRNAAALRAAAGDLSQRLGHSNNAA